MKCLVVDHSATLRRALVNSLRGIGFDEILEAADGKHALEICDAGVQIVVTEWGLPILDGIELTRQLRSNPDTAPVKVLMVTNHNMRQDVMEAVSAGVNGYLLRPFTPEALQARIERLLPAKAEEEPAADEKKAA